MITRRELIALKDNDGMTLKKGEKINYKSGWQVATEGYVVKSAYRAEQLIKMYNGNCGVWKSEGKYYIDKSHRVATKKEAMKIGRECNQISILKWSTMTLAYC